MVITANAEVAALPTSSVIFIVSRDSATYQSEVSLGWEPVETLLREDSREQDCMITEPKRERLQGRSTQLWMSQASAHNGKNFALCIPTLIDT